MKPAELLCRATTCVLASNIMEYMKGSTAMKETYTKHLALLVSACMPVSTYIYIYQTMHAFNVGHGTGSVSPLPCPHSGSVVVELIW